MRIEIALFSNTVERVQAEFDVDSNGEIQLTVLAGTKNIPVRLVLVSHLLVITVEPELGRHVTARWMGEIPRNLEWRKLRRSWDHSRQGWQCEVRQSVRG